MSYPRASCVWVLKMGTSIVIRDHLGIPLYILASCLLGVSVPLCVQQSYCRKGIPESKVLKEKNDKGMQPLGRLSRIAGRALIVPPPMPMVF